MKRWNKRRGMRAENPKIDAFLAEVDALCDKYGFEIRHEDGHGSFEIHSGSDCGGLRDATDCTEE